MKGITITLIEKNKTGLDAFGKEIYEEVETQVNNVLVAPTTSTDLPSDLDLRGKKIVFTLAIPKKDKHTWVDCKVKFFGKTFATVGYPQEGIDHLIPGKWNRKVNVELYG